MKKLLIGFTLLASMSSFADPLCALTKETAQKAANIINERDNPQGAIVAFEAVPWIDTGNDGESPNFRVFKGEAVVKTREYNSKLYHEVSLSDNTGNEIENKILYVDYIWVRVKGLSNIYENLADLIDCEMNQSRDYKGIALSKSGEIFPFKK